MPEPSKWNRNWTPNTATFNKQYDRLRLESAERVQRVNRYLQLHANAEWGEVVRRCGW